MPHLEGVVLELLEYKIDDFRARRPVRGGNASLWDLVNHLERERDRLSGAERQRFDRLKHSLSSFGGSSGAPALPTGSGTPELGSLMIGDVEEVELAVEAAAPAVHQTPEEREENAVLLRLARRVWWDDLDAYVQRLAAAWRSERDRYTARVVFATLNNLRRNTERSTFLTESGMRGFKVFEPIPPIGDPLVSLSDLDSLSEIARELVNVIMTLGRDGSPYPSLSVPDGQALPMIRQAALAVAADPYAGRTSSLDSRTLSSKQLRLAMQELARERLPDDQRAAQRRELERRLIEVTALERSEAQAYQRDTQMMQELVHVFFDRLADYLPTYVGGNASAPQLEGGVLFGVNPALRTDRVDPQTSAITVKLVGPVRLSLRGHDIALSAAGGVRNLFVDGREVEMNGAQIVHLGHVRLGVFREGDYVHLRLKDEGRTLAVRLAEALVVFEVLSSPSREELLTVLKVIANMVRGEPQEIVVQALARANTVISRAPSRRQALDGLLRGAARASELLLADDVIGKLVDRMVQAVMVDPTDTATIIERSGATDHELQVLTGEPLSFELNGQKITVRQYRGRTRDSQESLVAMLPGQMLGSFTDSLLVPHGSGTLLFARGEQEIVVLYLPSAGVEAHTEH